MLVKLGLDATQGGEQLAVLNTPTAMIREPCLVIRAVVFVIAPILSVFVAHVVILFRLMDFFNGAAKPPPL